MWQEDLLMLGFGQGGSDWGQGGVEYSGFRVLLGEFCL